MTQSELDVIFGADPYHVPRKETGPSEIRLYLREVDYNCIRVFNLKDENQK